MQKNSDINFNELSDIDIYELVLQGRLHSFPSGFWANEDIHKAKRIAINFLRYLIDEKLKLSKEDITKTVSKRFLTQYSLHTASKLFGRSAIKYTMAAYPCEFKPWQFKSDKVPQSFWTNEENRINAIKYVIEIELQWNIEDVKEKLSWNIIKEKGLMTLHTYYPNLHILVDAAYPNKIKPWELMNSEVSPGTWKVKSNRIAAIKWLMAKSKKRYSSINRKTFAKYGLSELLEKYYCDNPKRAFKEAFNKK